MIVCIVEWSKSSNVEVVTIIRFRKNRQLNYVNQCACTYFFIQLIEHGVK